MYNVQLLKCYANHAFLKQHNFQTHHPSLHMILETSAAAPLLLVMIVTMLLTDIPAASRLKKNKKKNTTVSESGHSSDTLKQICIYKKDHIGK